MLNWTNASQENYDLCAYGIKGEHWEPVGDKQYKTLNANWRWFPYAWVWNPQYDRLSDAIVGKQLELAIAFNDPDFFATSSLAGFTFDPEPVKNEWAQHQAIFAKYEVLEYGMVDPAEALENWAAEDLKNINVILPEIQRQLDAHLAGR